ncbi:MAG: hypothetical protein LBO72_04645, partial [Helicobacteraceae bacterium]|nr:hypothetical protein [Helicobacteraceae bacterium]
LVIASQCLDSATSRRTTKERGGHANDAKRERLHSAICDALTFVCVERCVDVNIRYCPPKSLLRAAKSAARIGGLKQI